jgi:hypothetical protein
MIVEDHPQLSGGIRFLDSARHWSYVDSRICLRYLAKVRGALGWEDLTPGMFDNLRPAA